MISISQHRDPDIALLHCMCIHAYTYIYICRYFIIIDRYMLKDYMCVYRCVYVSDSQI